MGPTKLSRVLTLFLLLLLHPHTQTIYLQYLVLTRAAAAAAAADHAAVVAAAPALQAVQRASRLSVKAASLALQTHPASAALVPAVLLVLPQTRVFQHNRHAQLPRCLCPVLCLRSFCWSELLIQPRRAEAADIPGVPAGCIAAQHILCRLIVLFFSALLRHRLDAEGSPCMAF
jgi:hypothetical protein